MFLSFFRFNSCSIHSFHPVLPCRRLRRSTIFLWLLEICLAHAVLRHQHLCLFHSHQRQWLHQINQPSLFHLQYRLREVILLNQLPDKLLLDQLQVNLLGAYVMFGLGDLSSAMGVQSTWSVLHRFYQHWGRQAGFQSHVKTPSGQTWQSCAC